MPLELYLATLILACIVLYALLGGADFGGGLWDLFATGPRADDQRRVIARAIGPIWEANHIWLIAVIVLLFSCFPRAYALISTSLHIPLTIMLFGIVLRGSSFVFRAYDTQREDVFHAWSRVFAISSVVAPYMLGVCLGAAASGAIRADTDGTFAEIYLDPWLAPFPLVIGLFTLAVFAFLAAVYLTHATDDEDLKEAFRVRALGMAVAVSVLAWVSLYLARTGAPRLYEGLWTSPWSWPFQGITAGVGVALLHALWTRRYGRARLLAGVQVVAVVCGFGAAQYPFIVTPHVSFVDDAAPDPVLWVVSLGMTGGLVLLVPAYAYLLRVFTFHGDGGPDVSEEPPPATSA